MDRPAWWQVWLSWVVDVQLEHLPPPPHPPLDLYLRKGAQLLVAPNAIYSAERNYRSFEMGMEALHPEFIPSRVCILGFGLGSILHIMGRKGNWHPEVTGVEIDPRITALARRRLPDHLMRKVQLIEADAIPWVSECRNQFDLVAVDLFVDLDVPEACAEPEFLQPLRNLIAPGGYLLYSRIDQEPDADRKRFLRNAKSLFPAMESLPTGGNTLFRWSAQSE